MKHWDAVLRITQYLRRVTERKEQSRTGVLHLRILVTVSLTLRQTLIVWILIVPLTRRSVAGYSFMSAGAPIYHGRIDLRLQ